MEIPQQSREPNTRLRSALADRAVSMVELAAVVGCSPKTVQRWAYDSRVIPHPASADKVARHLGVDVGWLWPRRRVPVNLDLVNLYPHIGAVPATVWTRTMAETRHAIDIATDTSLPPGLADIIGTRLAPGTALRLCLGGDATTTVRLAGARTRIATTPITGIYRFDHRMLVHLQGHGPAVNERGPVLHLRHREPDGVFDFYHRMFEQWWTDSETIAPRTNDKTSPPTASPSIGTSGNSRTAEDT